MKKTSIFLSGFVFGVLVASIIPVFAKNNVDENLPVEQMRAVVDVWNIVKRNYVDPVDDDVLAKACISGMAERDNHSSLLSDDDFNASSIASGNFAAIGLQLTRRFDNYVVLSAVTSGPSEKAGIETGDILIEIDGESLDGLKLSEVVMLLRGKPGTKVAVKLARKGESAPIEKLLVREIIKVNPVHARLLPNDLVYLKIESFTADSKELVKKSIHKALGNAQAKGFIIDLRNNPGGLLDSVIDVTNLFVNDGKILALNGREGSDVRTFSANGHALYDKQPIVVLVNYGTASGSEILAEALRTHNGAKVLGEKTFGMGTIQNVIALNSKMALKITTARWESASGQILEDRGIVPDAVLPHQNDRHDFDHDEWIARAVLELPNDNN